MKAEAGRRVAAMWLTTILLASAAGGSASQTSPAAAGQDSQPFRIAVNVNLVVLPAVVRDRQGRFVSDLRQQDFEVYEDGVLQTIRMFEHEDMPVTVGLVVDHSGSMHRKMLDVIAAASTFARSSNRQDQMFVVNFNEKVTLGLPADVLFTDDPEELQGAIARTEAAGETALYDAIVTALERLQTGSREKKVLLIISDGGDNKSTHSLADVLKLAGQSNAVIYSVGIFDPQDPDQNPGMLRRVARETGGEAFFPSELEEVVPICERIARDIRHQYTIGYTSSQKAQPGATRAIRVVAHGPDGKLSVRARTSYIAGGDRSPIPREIAK